MNEEEQSVILSFRSAQPKIVNTKDIWNTTYCGVPAIQAWQDFMLWERFLNEAHGTSLMELGTFLGGFTLYLQHQAYSRGMTFYTVDWQVFANFDDPEGALSLNGTKDFFNHLDVWGPEFSNLLDGILAAEKVFVLFCDGGNKPKEMQTFIPRLRPGDLVATHDWGNEITSVDLESVKHLIEPVLLNECEELQSLTRFFRRI